MDHDGARLLPRARLIENDWAGPISLPLRMTLVAHKSADRLDSGGTVSAERGGATRSAARHVPPEMLALLLLEMGLAFSLACAVASPGGLGQLSAAAANQALLAAATVGFTSFLLGQYRPKLFMRTRSLLLNTALGGVVAFPAVWAVLSACGMRGEWLVGPDRVWPTKILLTWLVALFAMRIAMLLAVRSKLFVRRVAVPGKPAAVARAVAAVRSSPAGFFEIVAPPAPGISPEALREAGIRNALISQDELAAMPEPMLAEFARAKVALEPEPVFWERHLKRVDIDHLTPRWFGRLDDRPPSRLQPVVNRACDVLLSLILLVVTLPLIVLVAIMVRLDSPGPVLYRQERVGLGGRRFVLLKFRSMICNAEERGPAWAQQRDPRVTRVGSIMRRSRVDELPQLLNVLRGEMSFIGPRPERPHFVSQLAEVIPFYGERARVKPGLTGWAQVNYPYGASVEDARAKLSYDLYYVRHRSVFLDLSILFATVRVILFQEGAR